MNKKTQLIVVTATVFFIATGFIVWFLLEDGKPPVMTETPETETSETETSEKDAEGFPCTGPVYGMMYRINSSGKCVPTGCKPGYSEISNLCVFSPTDKRWAVQSAKAARVATRIRI